MWPAALSAFIANEALAVRSRSCFTLPARLAPAPGEQLRGHAFETSARVLEPLLDAPAPLGTRGATTAAVCPVRICLDGRGAPARSRVRCAVPWRRRCAARVHVVNAPAPLGTAHPRARQVPRRVTVVAAGGAHRRRSARFGCWPAGRVHRL
eukprot:ctg_69.g61